jgi:hypothetical protein
MLLRFPPPNRKEGKDDEAAVAGAVENRSFSESVEGDERKRMIEEERVEEIETEEPSEEREDDEDE